MRFADAIGRGDDITAMRLAPLVNAVLNPSS
jgi:hypothetical protein